jgi:hypothetical protein
MIPESHPLRHLFHEIVADCYAEHAGLHDDEVSSYVADLLTDFTQVENLYSVRDASGKPVKQLSEMLVASDPINGSAESFDEERKIRKHIGDYTLFFTGMYPEAVHPSREPEKFLLMVQAGKESYYIVSQFNVFEYAVEAPLFGKLADSFESCVYGLNMVRQELDRRYALQAPKRQPRLM